ncbi:putative amino acid ABC transporter, substrate binding protein [Nocardia camponoti]|uniref:Amino acid ABC transporter, substrate binding protein n=2 Tax=Nocardia camponoti TaxID=1616106 RepID=A0A917QET7_9NOCA|nr:glycine betaine ABC transporter substrate-binding protein [Nocardia camponoti]GGK47307.1 putative amino acid ABC transporter, substrate binding protein [Nocardia camponoti]
MGSGAWRRTLLATLVATCGFAAVSCANEPVAPVVVVGADSSVESIVLAQIYSQALTRAGTATAVRTELSTPIADLDAARIALLPARNGALLERWDPESPARTPKNVPAALNAALPERLSVSDAADGTELRARVVMKSDEFATVSALAPQCASLTAGFADVPGLRRGLPQIDGCTFANVTEFADPESLREALRANQIQVGVVNGPTTAGDGLRVLDDPKYAVRTQNVVALHRSGIFNRVQAKKLNYVAGELNTAGLLELVAKVRRGDDPAVVARAWLDAHAL